MSVCPVQCHNQLNKQPPTNKSPLISYTQRILKNSSGSGQLDEKVRFLSKALPTRVCTVCVQNIRYGVYYGVYLPHIVY